MRENPDKPRTSAWRQSAKLAAIVAVVQTFLTISGRGIEGFFLWMLILFVAYWLLFTFLIWLWRRFVRRA
jgi:hypothetical protein